MEKIKQTSGVITDIVQRILLKQDEIIEWINKHEKGNDRMEEETEKEAHRRMVEELKRREKRIAKWWREKVESKKEGMNG